MCLPDRMDPAATMRRLEAAGWQEVEVSAHPELPGLMELDRDAAESAQANSVTKIYQGASDGLSLFITVNQTEAVISETETARYATCAVWDLEASEAIPDDLVTSWIDVPADVRVNISGIARSVLWPLQEVMPGAGNLRATFIPAASPAVSQTRFDGASIFLTSDLDASQ